MCFLERKERKPLALLIVSIGDGVWVEVHSRGEIRNHPSPGGEEGRGGNYADGSVNALRAYVVDKMSNHTSEFEQVVELVFQNVQYLLTVSLAPGDTLCVEAEHKTDGSRWRGDFTSRCQFSIQTLPKISCSLINGNGFSTARRGCLQPS